MGRKNTVNIHGECIATLSNDDLVKVKRDVEKCGPAQIPPKSKPDHTRLGLYIGLKVEVQSLLSLVMLGHNS